MTWTRLSDNFSDRPDLLRVSRSARLLHVEALIYCNKHLTDGHLPVNAVPRITDAPDAADLVAELLTEQVWEASGSKYVLDWTDQEPAERVRTRRASGKKRQDAFRDREALHASGDHSKCLPSKCPALRRNGVTGGVTDDVGNRTPSRPVPTRPVPSEDRGGTAAPPAPESAPDAATVCTDCGLRNGRHVEDCEAVA